MAWLSYLNSAVIKNEWRADWERNAAHTRSITWGENPSAFLGYKSDVIVIIIMRMMKEREEEEEEDPSFSLPFPQPNSYPKERHFFLHLLPLLLLANPIVVVVTLATLEGRRTSPVQDTHRQTLSFSLCDNDDEHRIATWIVAKEKLVLCPLIRIKELAESPLCTLNKKKRKERIIWVMENATKILDPFQIILMPLRTCKLLLLCAASSETIFYSATPCPFGCKLQKDAKAFIHVSRYRVVALWIIHASSERILSYFYHPICFLVLFGWIDPVECRRYMQTSF